MMGSKVLKNLIKIYTGLIFLTFISIDNVFAQNVKSCDSLACVIYFSDGFNNDTLQLKIGKKVVFNKIIVKSNLHYGVTGVEVWITDDYEVLLIENKEGNKKM